jgi:predicted TIM-barrel fold metal-dependent hydrolase
MAAASDVKIDAWTHILSRAYLEHVEAGDRRGPAAFLAAQRPLHDVGVRLQTLDAYGDYRQILTPIPYLHVDPGLAGAALIELVRRNNDDMADVVRRHPDRFAGFVAATPVADADAATEEALRSVRDLGALGVQLEADAFNLPLHEDRYDPLFAAMAHLGAGVWLHPVRTPATPGAPRETAPYLLWQVFGWPLDTTITIAHLIFAGIYDRHPGLKLIAHHGGGLIPHLSGRIGIMPSLARMDPAAEAALARLRRAPEEYLGMLYVDTALFGAPHGVRCVIDFFGADRVLFGTDAPFDTEGGSRFIPATIADVEVAAQDRADRERIFAANAMALFGLGGGAGAA